MIAMFTGETAPAHANAALARIRTEGGLPQAYLHTVGGTVIVVYGSYPGPESPRAQDDLKRLQSLEIDGSRPYALTYLAPIRLPENVGSLPQFNLSQAKLLYGRRALYTLQVGVYDRPDVANPTETDLAPIRKAAEEAAAMIRAEGELAFYHHGRTRSMVTVGVFDEADFDPRQPTFQSSRLRALKEKYPYNLYNGAGLKERVGHAARSRLQPSNLVVIPEPPEPKQQGRR